MFTIHTSNRLLRSTSALAALAILSAAYAGGSSVVLSPANSIQAAINSGNFSEIVLAPGTYSQTFIIDAGDAPITIRSQDPSDAGNVAATIIDGEFLSTSIIQLTAGVGSDVVIDGLTLTNGEATGDFGATIRGGAISCEAASPIVRRCVFSHNSALSGGGAMYLISSTMTIEDCKFLHNESSYGGAVLGSNSTVNLNRCVFQTNSAIYEGGACAFTIGAYAVDQCEFRNCFAGEFGGGLSNRSGAMLSATRCLFFSNSCGDGAPDHGRGGAISHNGSTNSFVENCVFLNNACAQFGGSIFAFQTITLRNTTHQLDHCGGGYGAVVTTLSTAALNMQNCIAWGFGGTAPINLSGGSNVTYCDIQGGFAGAGNIDVDPQFVDSNGELHLRPDSPCIDAGDTTKVVGQYPVDYDGMSRALDNPDTVDSGVAIVGISVDMGAYEFQPEIIIVEPNTCLADIVDNKTFQPPADGMVDGADLAYLLGAWGACQ